MTRSAQIHTPLTPGSAGARRSRWRRFGRGTGELGADVPQRSYARRQRIAIVFDSTVEEPEERRRFLVGQIQGHVIDGMSDAPTDLLPSLRWEIAA